MNKNNNKIKMVFIDINTRGECPDVPSILSYAKELFTAGPCRFKKASLF